MSTSPIDIDLTVDQSGDAIEVTDIHLDSISGDFVIDVDNDPIVGDFIIDVENFVGSSGTSGPKGDPGDPGPKGDPGEPGPQGPKGDPGDAGADGAPGAPGASGADGAPGPKGDPGADGAPGPAGEAGAQGPKGDQGDPGPVGAAGPKGDQGDPGLAGAAGPPGADGAVGPKGDQGDPGDPGDTGPQGLKGDPGDPGDTGPQGLKGDTGDTGPQGLKGDTGDTGPKGDTGDQGIQGIKGDTGDTGPQGIQGVKGDTGLQGIQGVKGDKGDTGSQGIQGIQGLKGDKGDTGDTGPAGPGHTILDEGGALAARTKLDFVGAGVVATDDGANNKTIITIPGNSGGVSVPAISGSAIKTAQVAANLAFGNYLLSADANPAFSIKGDGTINWGPGGSTVVDVALARAGTGSLIVSSSVGSQPLIVYQGSASGFAGTMITIQATQAAVATFNHIVAQANGVAGFYVRGDGHIYSTSTSITSTSDKTLKDDIRSLDGALKSIRALKPRRFRWNDHKLNAARTGQEDYGLIAQEVEEVFPHLVDDYHYKGLDSNDTLKALRLGDLMPFVVSAIQELANKVDKLEKPNV